MTTNSPNPVDGDVQALIEKEMDAFEKWFLSFRTDWDKGSLYRINYKKGPGYSSSYVQAMWKGWSAHKELTQTAQILRPVELPDIRRFCSSHINCKRANELLSEALRQQGYEVKND